MGLTVDRKSKLERQREEMKIEIGRKKERRGRTIGEEGLEGCK
jgi:hypothetical protein